ncbi:MAG: exostosin family protein [Candidatus Peribacteraceae bacterium]|nr:exostosin family protein [Candidatus Peribacteraceae bacterium]MDD5742218.1 exostosin family protein [Candidatus Peribacteraceae bacterium]
MKRVFFERLPGVPLIPLLLPNLQEEQSTRQLFQQEAFRDLTEPLVEVVTDPAQADVHLLPHHYPLVARNTDYLGRCRRTAKRHNKRIVVFWNGDSTGPVALENAVVFRTSQYDSKMRNGEHIMPAYAEDLKGKGLFVRDKTDAPPVIGFCGWAQYKNAKNAVGSFLQALPHEAYALLTGYPQSQSFIKGLWLRRRILSRLSKSTRITPDFVLRSSHSAHAKTIRLDPAQARKEYVDNLLASDFALCIRGDGNYSLRFYEALSLGRVPILLNTDVRLPLEGIVPYSSFVLTIHIADMLRIDEIVADFWSCQTDQSFLVMQLEARNAFEKYLSSPRYLAYAVEHLF